MSKKEKNALLWIERNLPGLTVILVCMIGFLIRFSLRRIVSRDADFYLLPWYDAIKKNGLYQQTGDYNFPYQFLIWIMAKLPIPPLYAYKCLSCIFDYFLAAVAGLMVFRVSGKDVWSGVLTFSAVLLSPVVFLNSAAWAQCDAMFTTFAILSILCLDRGQYNCALICLGLSFAFKLQAVFLLPLFLFIYFVRKEFSILRFSLVPVTLVACSLPMCLWGRNLSEVFTIYIRQSSEYPGMAFNYPSLWTLLCQPREASQYYNLKTAAILFTVCCLAMLMIWWIRKQYDTHGKNLLIMAFLLTYTCVLLLPAMHERYGFIYEICAILLAVLIPRTIPLCIALLCITLNTYGAFLFGVPLNLTLLTVLNLLLFGAYVYFLKGELERGKQCRTEEISNSQT